MRNNGENTLNKNIIWKNIIANGIKSNYILSNTGLVYNIKYKKFIKPQLNSTDGYLYVDLYINKTKVHKYVHSLIAENFIYNDDPEHKTQVNHINGIKTDNRVENLEWATPKENIRHAFNIGLASIGSDHYRVKHSDEEIYLVCKL